MWVNVSTRAFDFIEMDDGAQSFRWVPLKEMQSEILTFPIDRQMVALIKEKYL